MALTNGPLFSLEALGQLGKAIVYSKWRGRSYVRKYVIPANPQSAAQFGMRSVMAFLSEQWSELSLVDQNSWFQLAQQGNIPAFNAYIRENLRQWANSTGEAFYAPSQAYPITRTGVASPISNQAAVDLGGGNWQITWDNGAGAEQWGTILFASDADDFIPQRFNARLVVPTPESESELSVLVTGLGEGDRYFSLLNFSDDGNATDPTANFPSPE